MAPFRRKAPDPEIISIREGFRRVAGALDAAQRALLAAVPTARAAAEPLPGALDAFLEGLARVEALMPGWRAPRSEALWRRCAEALVEARAEAERLRRDPSELGFEALNARLGEVISPLEEFADVAGEMRRLR